MFPFEDFGAARKTATKKAQEPTAATVPSADVSRLAEKAKNEGYEAGYKAGWDDAVQADEETRARVGAELSRNLQDLGFTFHEARSHVIKALEPLLFEMIEKVLPELVSQSIGQSIIDEILPVAEGISDAPIEILINPQNRQAVETLVIESLPMVVNFVEEPSLSDGQVFLRLGSKEQKIDLDGAIEAMRGAVEAAFTLNKDVIVNG